MTRGMFGLSADQLTACSYEKHFLEQRTRNNDFDVCSHPLCVLAVIGHWKNKAKQMEKELERVKKVHEEHLHRLLSFTYVGPDEQNRPLSSNSQPSS